MQNVEMLIAKRCIADLLAAGYLISVDDGEETTLRRSRDPEAIFAAMATTDEDYLHVHKPEQPPVAEGEDPDSDTRRAFGWVRFIYGNDGWDVINDYTTNLKDDLAGTNALVDEIEGGTGG